MNIRLSVGLVWLLACAAAVIGCEIHNCEEGADCRERNGGDSQQQHMCTLYCGRLSACGAPQASDFDQCLESCADRFEALPDETWELCACADTSRCADLIEGRCSSAPAPQGGASSCPNASCSATGGSPNNGHGSGGAPGSGGSAPAASGGSAGPHAGNPSGGESAAGAPATMSCAASCDCPSGQRCIDGYCVD